jgi:REP element-mobilizing transposase RayT
MPRKARIDAPLALNHIIARGIERRNIFRDSTDRDNFLDRLESLLSSTETICYAWALMPNHFHLLLRTVNTPISDLMKRLLTGYVVTFNRRHKRVGRLFQNRFKSILCQEEIYFLELIRYIHLNPIRAGQVTSLAALEEYKYSGHGGIMGRFNIPWQDADSVLSHFGNDASGARKMYCQFIEKGVDQGRRPDLTGGGVIRSSGGWTKYASERKMNKHLKGDERILGNSNFVDAVLNEQRERMERKYRLQTSGFDFDALLSHVASLYRLDPEDIVIPGMRGKSAEGRALLCYWCRRELGIKGTELSKKLGISPSAVSLLTSRGRKLAIKNRLKLDLELLKAGPRTSII